VIDGAVADLILVAAQGDLGLCLLAVEASAPGITIDPLSTLDMTRKQSQIRFSETPGVLVGLEGAALPSLLRTFELATTAIAAEEVGGAQRVLESSVDYATNRIQYGRPIGSFQAIKHKCADMLVAVETAKSALSYASWAAATGSEEIPIASSLAKAYCSEAFLRCAAQNIQIHGGIGFTWEHDAHLYFRRAKSSELLLGSPWYHRELLAQHVGI
jgi:alkylation response protein AidB-like acyl-CoA dehydrogenase